MTRQTVTTPPDEEPVDVETVSGDLGLSADDDNDLISRLIVSSRIYHEELAGIRVMDQTVRVDLDAFPVGEIKLEVYPLQQVTTVAYTDSDGNPQTVLATNYEVDLERSLLRPIETFSWPSTKNVYNAVQITCQAGYATVDLVPENLLHSVRMLTGHYYACRGDQPEDVAVPKAIEQAITLHRRRWPV